MDKIKIETLLLKVRGDANLWISSQVGGKKSVLTRPEQLHDDSLAIRKFIDSCNTVSEEEQDEEFDVVDHIKLVQLGIVYVKRYFGSLNQLSATVLYLLKQIVPYKDFSHIYDVFYLYSLFDKCLNVKDTVDVFKMISVLAKKYQEAFSTYWMWFVDWNVTVGFNIHSDVENLEKEVRQWLVDIYLHGDKKRNAEYNIGIKDALDKIFGNGRPKVKPISVHDFIVTTELWKSRGSSRGEFVFIQDNENNIIQSAKNKTALAMKYDVTTLMDEMFDENYVEELRPSVKVELGRKDRVIISGGFIMQLRMAYVSYYLLPALSEEVVASSPLFQTSSVMIQRMMRRCKQIATKVFVNFPIDVSNFDRNITMDEILIYIDCLSLFFRKYYTLMPFLDSVINLLYVIKTVWLKTKVVIGGKWVSITHGLPSGIRWTAEFDTFINLARVVFFNTYTNSVLHVSPVIEATGQGDDDDFVMYNYYFCDFLVKWYNQYNIVVHPQKNFVSLHRTEFLRRVYDSKGVRGYLIRKLMSSLFRDPVGRSEEDDPKGLRNIVSGVVIWCGRGANKEKVMRMLQDIVYTKLKKWGVDMSKDQVERFIHTPTALGGLGLMPSPKYLPVAIEYFIEDSVKVKLLAGLTGLYRNRLQFTEELFGHVDPKVTTSQICDSLIPSDIRKERTQLRKVFPIMPKPLKDRNITIVASETAKTFRPWRVREELKNILVEDVVESLIDKSDFDGIKNITHSTILPDFILIQKKSSRAVLIEWIRGKLTSSVPLIPGYADFFVSHITNMTFENALAEMYKSNHRVTYDMYLSLKCQVEFAVTNYFVRYTGIAIAN